MRLMVEGNGTSFVLYRIDPGARFDSHRHPFSELGVVLAGEGTFTVAGEARPLREGDAFFVPPEVPHGFSVPATAATVVVLNVTVAVPSEAIEPTGPALLRLAATLAKSQENPSPGSG